jgi:hypothetical protein
MPPSNLQALVGAAWAVASDAVEKALGAPADRPISKVCPSAPIGETIWKSEGLGTWAIRIEPRPSAYGLPTGTTRRELTVGGRTYVDVQHRLTRDPDHLNALSVARETDSSYADVKQWAAAALHHFARDALACILENAVTFTTDPANDTLEKKLKKAAESQLITGRCRLVLNDHALIHDPPQFIGDQVSLEPAIGDIWKALLLPKDRSGIVAERAYDLTLGWKPAHSGADLVLQERYAFRVPTETEFVKPIVIR